MRRSEREITDKNEIEKFISEEQIMRVAFYDDGEIYIVPVNYGYTYNHDEYTFYFHGAKAGRKYELSKVKSLIGFEIDGKYKLLEGEIACDFSAKFQSIVGTGEIYIVNDIEEKENGLNSIMKHVTKVNTWNYDRRRIDSVAVFKINVKKMSCKAK
jgi:nitroimidazol reductase NimA-like FMN-containing flavoprotein (pyridoxamine 5'-phosphate oxidase superfamily)